MSASTIYKADDPGVLVSSEPEDELLEPVELMLKLYRESRRSAVELRNAPRAFTGGSAGSASPTGMHRILLPPPEAQSKPIDEALVERASIRHYAQRPITQRQLSSILKIAAEGDKQDWPGEEEAGAGIDFLVVAWRLEGVEPAVYRYEASTHTLARLGPVPDQKTEAVRMVLQVEFADAPVIVLTVGNLAAASELYGGWGHRQLLLRAGAAGQRMWMASIGVGLVGTVFAGFLNRAARSVAGVDGYRKAGLFAYSTGYRQTRM